MSIFPWLLTLLVFHADDGAAAKAVVLQLEAEAEGCMHTNNQWHHPPIPGHQHQAAVYGRGDSGVSAGIKEYGPLPAQRPGPQV